MGLLDRIFRRVSGGAPPPPQPGHAPDMGFDGQRIEGTRGPLTGVPGEPE